MVIPTEVRIESMRKIISFILPDLRGGGAERVFVTLANYLASNGYAVEIILLNMRGDLINSCHPDIKIIDLNCHKLSRSILPLRSHLSVSNPEALLVGMWPLTAYAILANLLSKNKTKIVVTDHSILSKSGIAKKWITKAFMRLSIGLLYPRAFARVGVSEGVATDIAKLGFGVKNIKTVYNPIFLDKTHVEDNAPIAVPYILAVGSFKPVKDFFTLIKAFNLYKKKNDSDVKLVILGDGPLRIEMQTLIAQLDLVDDVIMPGFYDQPFHWYQHAKLFVLSSINEGFGNVIVEAMSCGVPIVSTDCESGPREILSDGKYGKLVPVGDEALMSQAISESFGVHHDQERLKLRASEFTVDKIANQYLDLIFPERVFNA